MVRPWDGGKTALDPLALNLQQVYARGWLVTVCIGLLTLCGFLIGLTILFLFLGETTGLDSPRWALASFLLGVMSFLAALVLFFLETVAATRILNFGDAGMS